MKRSSADDMNPLVSKVHGKEKRWGAEFAALRGLCLGSGLNEELKWGQACYVADVNYFGPSTTTMMAV